MFIKILLISTTIILVFIWIIFYSIDKILDISLKKQINNINKVEQRLNLSINSLCSQLKIPIVYCDKMQDAVGRLIYYTDQEKPLLENSFIEIIKSVSNKPYVLAHEVGHYMAIKQREDFSEEGADKEAYKLCCSILTDEEKIILEVPLSIYFK